MRVSKYNWTGDMELEHYVKNKLVNRYDGAGYELETLQNFVAKLVDTLADHKVLSEDAVNSLFYHDQIKFDEYVDD